MSHDVPSAPGTVFELPLDELGWNPFVPIPSVWEIEAVMAGTTEDWFSDVINRAPAHMQAWLAGAPAAASVLADFIKLAVMLIPQSPDNCYVTRMKLDGTIYTGDKTARQWLYINTEAIQGHEYTMVAFLQPVLHAWHPYVQLPAVSLGVAKELAMVMHWTTRDWAREAFFLRCTDGQPNNAADHHVPLTDAGHQERDTGGDNATNR